MEIDHKFEEGPTGMAYEGSAQREVYGSKQQLVQNAVKAAARKIEKKNYKQLYFDEAND